MAGEEFKCQYCGEIYPVEDAKRVISSATKNKYWVCPQCEPIVKDYLEGNQT